MHLPADCLKESRPKEEYALPGIADDEFRSPSTWTNPGRQARDVFNVMMNTQALYASMSRMLGAHGCAV